MSTKCSSRKSCYFYAAHSDNPIVIKEGWIKKYCHNSFNSNDCSRIKSQNKNGIIPPADIGPTGEAVLVKKM